tara:strand:+ start:10522 stop:10830 length:309 start_codon:yes stop_codon:yes gene_type:complete
MYKILITTSNNRDVLSMIAKDCILNKKLSPCAHIIDNNSSFYIWNDDFISDKEYILMIKCKEQSVQEIKEIINAKHNYDIPELISIEFDIASDKYKEWFNKK